MKSIKGVKFLGVTLEFYVKIPIGSLNIGHVRLEREGRSFVLDTVESTYLNPIEDADSEANHTTIEVVLEAGIDGDEALENSKFDLTADDLHANDLKASLWWEEAVEVSEGVFEAPESVTLFVRFNNSMTKAINLENE